MLAVVVTKEYVTEQLDAFTAFLNNVLKEEVYMEGPHGIANDKNIMCKLDKATYCPRKLQMRGTRHSMLFPHR